MEDNNAITERPNDVNSENLVEENNKLQEMAQNLYNRVKQLENTWMLTRANMLFEVIKLDAFSKEDREKAVNELSEFLFPKEKENKEQTKEE